MGGAYLLRDAPSDVVRGRPSRPASGRSSRPPKAAKTTPPPPGYSESGFPELPVDGEVSPLLTGAVPKAPPVPDLGVPDDEPMADPDDVVSLDEAESGEHERPTGTIKMRVRRATMPEMDATTPTVERVRPTDIDALRSPSEEPPPTDPRLTIVRELMTTAPGDEHLVLARVLRVPGALALAARHFPGPLWFDRRGPYRKLPPATSTSAVCALLVHAGEEAHPYVVQLLGHADVDVRFYALLVAREAPADDYAMPVARLVLDRDAGVRQAARAALRQHRRVGSYPEAVAKIRELIELPKVRQVWRLRAIHAAAELGDADAVGVLIEALADQDRAIARAAHQALRTLTCQDFGTMRMPWRRWLKSHGRKHRMNWLIEALADRREELRLDAFRQLVALTGESFGLSDAAPRDAFVKAQGDYARWWRNR